MSKVVRAKVEKLRALPSGVSYGGFSLSFCWCLMWSVGDLRSLVGRKLGGNGKEVGPLLVLLCVLAINQAGRSASLLAVSRLLFANGKERNIYNITADVHGLCGLGYLVKSADKFRGGGLRLRVTPSGLAVLRDIERELSGLRVKGLE